MKWSYILHVYISLSVLLVPFVMCRGSKTKRLVNHGPQATYKEAKQICKSKGQSLPTVDDLEEIGESTSSFDAIWISPSVITKECRKDYITCDKDRCVSPTQVCDAVDHCLDGSDELECELKKKVFEEVTDSPNQNVTELDNRPRPSDCSDLLTTGTNISGVYTIYPLSTGIKVYCDMESNGGGWTVLSNRLKQKPEGNFKKNWKQYKEGFGDPANEYWMGNEALHAMTNSRDYTLRIDASIVSEGRTTWGEWAHFKVQSEDDKYKLSVSGYETSSSMEDGTITNQHGMYFTSKDRDNDNNGRGNCAKTFGGGFWYNYCADISPTGRYSSMKIDPWSVTDSTRRFASHLQMKIRPK